MIYLRLGLGSLGPRVEQILQRRSPHTADSIPEWTRLDIERHMKR